MALLAASTRSLSIASDSVLLASASPLPHPETFAPSYAAVAPFTRCPTMREITATLNGDTHPFFRIANVVWGGGGGGGGEEARH